MNQYKQWTIDAGASTPAYGKWETRFRPVARWVSSSPSERVGLGSDSREGPARPGGPFFFARDGPVMGASLRRD